MRLRAAAAFGMEALVEKQLHDLGVEETAIDHGQVVFEGGKDLLVLANLALREADRIFVEVGSFQAKTYDQLFEGIRALDWPDWLTKDARFPVSARTVKSRLFSPSDIQAVGKKALAEKMGSHFGLDRLPETGPLFPIDIHIREDLCRVSIDSTGKGLFRRGYRTMIGEAPLKETLAAGLVDLSFWNPDRPLLDPFCGSGTLLIEAARKARKIDPGLDRDFLFMDWPWLGEETYQKIRQDRVDLIDRDLDLDIQGFDIDKEAILLSMANADRAQVKDDIQFISLDMREVGLQENFGVLITNPPYGERMGEGDEVKDLMVDFIDHYFVLNTWSFYVITARKDFERLAGREADRRRKLFNGGMETTYYQFYGPNPKDFL